MAILSIFWLHCAGSIKELTLESNGRRWLSRVSVSVSSSSGSIYRQPFVAILSIFWLHCAGSIKELTLKSNGRRWLSRVSVSSSSGPSGLSKELEHKTEEEKENCQANEKPNNGGYSCLSKGTRRI